MSLIKEFKEFAVKGNMIELAIGIMIGAAFNGVVSSLVKDVLTPIIGLFTNGVDVSQYSFLLKEEIADAEGAITQQALILEYGLFLEKFIDFMIVAMVVFALVKFINSLKRKAEDEGDKTIAPPKDIQLLSDIKEELQKMNGVKSEAK